MTQGDKEGDNSVAMAGYTSRSRLNDKDIYKQGYSRLSWFIQ
jgi:hypothetical protein